MISRWPKCVSLILAALLFQGCPGVRTATSTPPPPPTTSAPSTSASTAPAVSAGTGTSVLPVPFAPPQVLPFLLNVQPQFPGVQQAQSMTLIATATDQLGVTLVQPPVFTWSLRPSPAAGTLLPFGATAIYTASSTFSVDPITVVAGTSSALAQAYTSGAPPAVSLSIVPVGAKVYAGGGTQQFVANVVDAGGYVLAKVPVTWTVVQPQLGGVSPTGVFTAGNTPGTVTVSASGAALSGSATVNIVAYQCQYPFCQAVPPGQETSVLWLCDGVCSSGHCYRKNVALNRPQYCAANPATASTQPATALYTDLSIDTWQTGDPDLFLCDGICGGVSGGFCTGQGQLTTVPTNCAAPFRKVALRPAGKVPQV